MTAYSSVRIFILLVILLEVSRCAKVSAPSGGPKDREAPRVTRSVPESGTINFTDNEIDITFNEFVVLDNINEKFMVSPPLSKKPKIAIRGKSLRIVLEEDLRDSTTYTFYFQDAIRDLNEGNPINNFQFVLSTGPFIDSLSVTGNVYSALTLDPPENTLVLLYSNLQDSAVTKHLPDYITRVEANGEFRINNVHQGIYRLYALQDIDNSKNYNRRDEEFAFYDSAIVVTPEKNYLPVTEDTVEIKPVNGKVTAKPPIIGEYKLILFQAEKKDRYLTSSSRSQPFQLTYTLSLPPDSLRFGFAIPGKSSDSWFIEKNRNRDTITVWLTDSSLYNRQQLETIINYPFTDTLGITEQKTDTILMRYLAPRPPRGRVVKPTPYKVNPGNLSAQVRPDKKIIFTAPTPFREIDTSRIRLFETSREGRIKIPYSLMVDSLTTRKYHMETQLKPGSNYLFIADSAAFKSIYEETSDSTGIRFSVMPVTLFGNLIIETRNYDGSSIIQVLDNSDKEKREAYLETEEKVEFPLLEKGPCRLRAVFDLNHDRKWTTGDFDLHLQPEPVTFLDKEIEIKENWTYNEVMDLGIRNFKDSKLQKIKTSSR
jgi:hypothetical protein